jgi:hypothetical protein
MYFKQRERAENLEAIAILESAVQIVMRFSCPIEFEPLNFRRSGPLAYFCRPLSSEVGPFPKGS